MAKYASQTTVSTEKTQSVASMVTVTEEQLKARLEYWQKRLRLMHWRITVSFGADYSLPNSWADAAINRYDETADIKIVEPAARHNSRRRTPIPEIEFSLVHELLEIVLDPLLEECKDVNELLKEQAINRIANALLESDRTCSHHGSG